MTDDTPQAAAPPKPKFGKQQIIAAVLTLLVLVVVFVVVLPKFGDYGAAWDAVKTMSWWELALIITATVVLIVVYVFPFQAALPGLKFRPAFVTRQTSFMISNVIPGGGAWGLAVQYGMLLSYGYGPAPTSSVIGITSVWNTFITLALPVFALIGLFIIGQGDTSHLAATVVAAIVVVVAIGVFYLILRSESTARHIGEWVDKVVAWAAGLFHKEVDFDAADALVDFRESIVDVVSTRWLLITAANLGQQLTQFFVLYLAVVALQGGFDGPIGIVEAFAAFAFGRLATFIPIPPGGLGTTDAIITSMLTGFGLDSNSALAATMIWRGATYFPQVIIGVITFLVWRRGQSKDALKAQAAS